MFTITIENLLRFHEYFDNNIISIKNFPLDFEKGSIYSYILWLLCTNVERHGREKPWGGGDSHIKWAGMLVEKFQTNP